VTSSLVRRRMPASSISLVALAAALALPTSLDAQQPAPTTLSMDQAIRIARENNPSFLQQVNDIGVARSSVRAAYGNLLPSLSASNSYGYTASGEARYGTVEFGTQPESYTSSYSVGMNLQLSGASLLEPSVTRAQKRATERRVEGVGADLDAQVAQQYLSVLQGRELVAQAQQEVARTAEHVRLAEARLEVGAGTPLDVQRAQVQHGQAEVGLVEARNTADIAAITLGQYLGTPLEPSVELTSTFEIFDPAWTPAELVEMALGTNPSLLAAEASATAARTSVKSARTRYLPTLGFNVGVNGWVSEAGSIDGLVNQQVFGLQQQFAQCHTNNELMALIGRAPTNCSAFDPNDPTVVAGIRNELETRNSGWPFSYARQPLSASVTISLPIFQGFDRELQVDQARAAAADARHQVRQEDLRLRQAVAAGVRNLESAYETALLQERVVASATEELRLAQERFRFGAANSIEVTDAQANLAQAEQAQIDAVYNFHKSLAALEALVGRSLR
jgi:outer membrane protein